MPDEKQAPSGDVPPRPEAVDPSSTMSFPPNTAPLTLYCVSEQDAETKALRAAYLEYARKWLGWQSQLLSDSMEASAASRVNVAPSEAEKTALSNLEEEYTAFLHAWLENSRAILVENRRVQESHNFTCKVIGWVVHVLLGGAVIAAIVEFREAQRLRRRAREASQEISIGLDGIALKTSRQSMLFLGFAIILYLAYLRFVLPIFEVVQR